MLHSLHVSYYSLQSYSSSTGDATLSIRFLLFPVELQQLYRRCYTAVYTFPTIPCRATVALQEMLHSLYVSCCSLFTIPCRATVLCRRCYTVYTFPTNPCRATPARKRCYTVYTFPTIPCRASSTGDATQSSRFLLFPVTVALQEMLHRLYVSYYSLQSYSSSTGDATQSIRFLLFPVTVALQEMLHSLYVSDYSRQSQSSSTGDATQSTRFLLFPVELYRRCYTVCMFPTIPCRGTVALQEMLHSLYVSYYSLQSYSSSTGDATQSIRFLLFPVELQQHYTRCNKSLQIYSGSTGDATQSIRFLLLPVELKQLYRRCYTVYTFPTIPCRATDATQSIRFRLFPVELQQRRCYTVYTFPAIPCRATVALHEMLHSLYVSCYSLQSYSGSTRDATQSIRFLLFPVTVAPQEMLHSLYVFYYSLQSYSSSTGHSRKRIDCVATPVERKSETYRLCSISCRATVALQGNVQTVQHLLQSYCSSTGNSRKRIECVASPVELLQLYRDSRKRIDCVAPPVELQSIRFLLFPVELQQLYRRCYTVYVSYYSLQSYSSSTGDATQSIRFLLSSTGDATQCIRFLLLPVELQQLYRRCYTVYTFPTIPCRATVALQEMLHSPHVSYYSHATQSIRFLLFPLELQQLYRRCYTVYTFPSIPCRATVALQEMLHSLYVSYYSLWRYSSSTQNATQSIRFLLFPVELQQLYRRCYTVYTFPTIPCRATVALQEMLHSLYVSYCSLQSYSSSTGDATLSIRFLLFPVELQQHYRRCNTVYRSTVALQEMLHSLERFLLFPVELKWLYRRCYTVYTFPTVPCRATVALQEMLHSLYVSYHSLQSYCSSTGDATQSIRFLLFPVEIQQLYRRCYTVQHSARLLLFPVELEQLYRRCYTVYIYVFFYSLQSSGSTGDATQSIRFLLFPDATQSTRFLLFPVEIQQLYRRCHTGDAAQSIRFLPFPVELQQLHRRCYTAYYVSYQSLWSYSSSTGDATQSIRFLLLPVELQQLYRRCYTVYTFPTFHCRATAALQEMLHRLYVPYYSLQSYREQQLYISCGATVALLHCVVLQSYRSYYSLCIDCEHLLQSQQLYRRCYTALYVSTFSTVEPQQLYRRCHTAIRFLLQSYSSSTGDATQSIRSLLFPVELLALQEMLHSLYVPTRATVALQEMLHSLYVSYYSLQSYSSSTGDATQSIRFLLFPVELKQLYRRCYTVYTFPTIPCRATAALQEMLHRLYVPYYSLQSYSSSTGDATHSIRFYVPCNSSSTGDATQSIRFLLFPVELQQLYRRCYTVYTFPTIPCRATVALQEMLHSLYVSYYSLQRYSSSTGDATQSIRFLLFPVELQQLYRRCYCSSTGDTTLSIRFLLFPVELQWLYRRCCTVYTFPTIPCRATVALQEMLHSLYVPYYSLQSYSSSTGDATPCILFLLFPVEPQQLYRRCYTVYTFPTIPCRATVALQETLHSLYVSYYSLQSYRRCYAVYTFLIIPCRATVALQEMLHSLYVSYFSLQSYSSSMLHSLYISCYFPVELQQLYRRCYTVYTFPTIPCRATVALQEMLHRLYVSYYSLQSYSSPTGDATQLSIRFLLFPVELHQLYRRCYTVYTSLTIPCRAKVALQEMLHSLYVSYYCLQIYSSSTGDATQSIRFLLFPVELQFPTIPCRDTVALQAMLHSLYVSYYSLQMLHSLYVSYSLVALQEMLHSLYVPYCSLQSYSSSTGDATQFIRFLLFPVEIQQLYRRCYTVYTFPTNPCRATVALQEMLHSLYVSYYALQSYSNSTGDATQSLRFLLFPVDLQQVYRRCYTVYTFPTIRCRATVALEEMLHSLYVSYYSLQRYSSSTGDATQSIRSLLFPVELQQLYRRCYTVYTFPTIPCRATDATQSIRLLLFPVYYSLQSYSSSTGDATQYSLQSQQLYRRCYTVYTFPTIPCRATAALQEMLHRLYVSYYSLQSYSSSTGDATQSIRFLLFPVTVALQEMLHSLYFSYYSLQSYSSSTGDASPSIRFLLFPLVYTFPTIPCRATVLQLYRRCYTVYTFPAIP